MANLRDPDFLLVMGNLEVVERSHLFVISGGFQKEADLDDLERWGRTCVRRKNGQDLRIWTRMGTEPSTHPSIDGTFRNNYSKHGRVEGCGLCPGGAGEPWANYEQGRSRVSSGAI